MQVREIMTKGGRIIEHGESVRHAAEMMRDLDVGILPVREENQLTGTVTDRDITVRAVADGASLEDTPVSAIMSRGVLVGYEDEDAETAAATMEEKQVRRLLVMDRDDRFVGVLSVGDLAVRGEDRSLTGEVMEETSRPQ